MLSGDLGAARCDHQRSCHTVAPTDRPEERVQQVQVWRSWRLEDDVSSREWHVFFAPRHDWNAPRFDWNVSVRALQMVETVQGTQHVNAEVHTTLAVY